MKLALNLTRDVVLSHIWHSVEHWVMFNYFRWCIRSTWIHPRRPHIRGKSDSASPFWSHTSIAIAIKNWLYSNRWFNPFNLHHCVHVYLQFVFWTAFCICTVFRLRPFSLTSLSYFCYITTPNNAGPVSGSTYNKTRIQTISFLHRGSGWVQVALVWLWEHKNKMLYDWERDIM